MERNNEFLNYASAVVGDKTAEAPAMGEQQQQSSEAPATPEMGGEPAPIVTEQPQTPAEPAAAPVVAEEAKPIEFNINQWLEQQTGGLFKDPDSLKLALPKITSYDDVLKQKDELEKNQVTLANDWVKTYNQLVLDGASLDQQKAFIKLNEVGDFSTMSPLELKVAKMVLVDGYKENAARLQVAQDFPVDTFIEGTDDRIILEEKLRVSANKDLTDLNRYKADLSVFENPAKKEQEQAQLRNIAIQNEYAKDVDQHAPAIATSFSGLGKIKLAGEKGAGDSELEFLFEDNFKSGMTDMVKYYLSQEVAPITPERIAEVERGVKAEWLLNNYETMMNRVWNHAASFFGKAKDAEYENRGGLAEQKETPEAVQTKQDQMDRFIQDRILGGRK